MKRRGDGEEGGWRGGGRRGNEGGWRGGGMKKRKEREIGCGG